ncbi:serine/threonine-protein phosphatase 2A 56 kDa regulatory subunit delta isoform-like [Boleophthalmus pectinirostris]|uniref:serine/threonine-protein phosphatase 2A 56 kDa regulatory subunit delta isoform-like n=1 Tax=Boleophthalmus pectinirostris TaxID=150288 RepID=UPI00242C745B|nr:serine/threonine-protein phosphatase 2A 56 kDa regulatory subunit delta isoform-like [Boleophthalmus pectinirostris]
MPHKSKKDKESSKSGRSKKSDKNGPSDQDGKKVPPAAQLLRVKQPGSHSAVKREKRFSTSTFPLSANRELQKLTPIVALQEFLDDQVFSSSHDLKGN